WEGRGSGGGLSDDVVDIEVEAVEAAAQTGKLVPALAAGDGVDANDDAFAKSFPYVALPNVGAVNKGGGTGGSAQSSAAGPAQPGSTAPAERSIDAQQTAVSSGVTANTVITATIGAVAVALAAVLILGWLMRRRRP